MAGYNLFVLAPFKNPTTLANKNAELAARLKVAEEINRQLRQEAERLRPLEKTCEQLTAELKQKTERTVLLEEELKWLRNQFYGRSSQASPADACPDQALLFNEAEVLAAIQAADEAQANRTTKIEEHERKHTGGRKAIPKHFPRIIIPHALPEAERMCTQCPVPHPLTPFGEETSERYGYTPPKIWVEHHVRLKYACEVRREEVKTAPPPPHILPKTNASSSLLAFLITAKFCDGLPLYRVARQLERSQMDITPGLAGVWVNQIGEKIIPLINLMNDELFQAPFIHMDETYLQILKSDKATGSDHYMVVRAAGPPGKRIILYNYIASRTTESLKNLLIGPEGPYTGKLLTDGLERYDEISLALKLEHFGCLQHCRAYYYKARKVSQLPSSRSLASVAIDDYIRKVYVVEDQIKTLRAEHEARGETLPLHTVLALRQQKSKPVMEKFKAWVEDLLPGTPPNSALGKALAYTQRQWPKLIRHLDHGDMPVDNNYIEQQIKQYAIGRKAWLYSYDKVGAEASANLYSLVQTARANDVEPYAYLNYLFDRLPLAATVEDFEALLPWNVMPAALIEHRKKQDRLLQSAA